MKKIMAGLLILTLMYIVSGCGSKETYGTIGTAAKNVKVSDILKNSASMTNDMIIVNGTIAQECPTGCWFKLKDGDSQVHVDIEPEGLAIPQKVGKKVQVEGKVSVKDGQIQVIGKGVTIY